MFSSVQSSDWFTVNSLNRKQPNNIMKDILHGCSSEAKKKIILSINFSTNLFVKVYVN